MRQRKFRIAIADACQFRRQIGEPMGNKMHNVALALNASPTPIMRAARMLYSPSYYFSSYPS
jgi:hypothetical protein